MLSTCSSLVIIIDDKDEGEDKGDDGNKNKTEDSRIVQFSHFSVKEFLMSSRFVGSSRDVSHYHIEPEPAHTILAQACLGILLQMDDRVSRNEIKNFPLAIYAVQYWVKHARAENVSSHIKDGIDRLFDPTKPHFAAWLWIYNEDNGGSSTVTMFPTKPAAVPLYYAARFGFCDLIARLLAKHPGRTCRGWVSDDTVTRICGSRSYGRFFITGRTLSKSGYQGR